MRIAHYNKAASVVHSNNMLMIVIMYCSSLIIIKHFNSPVSRTSPYKVVTLCFIARLRPFAM